MNTSLGEEHSFSPKENILLRDRVPLSYNASFPFVLQEGTGAPFFGRSLPFLQLFLLFPPPIWNPRWSCPSPPCEAYCPPFFFRTPSPFKMVFPQRLVPFHSPPARSLPRVSPRKPKLFSRTMCIFRVFLPLSRAVPSGGASPFRATAVILFSSRRRGPLL